ncbi:MAG: hypothetical protein ABIE74_05010 [Pseudomonadota bacterium]
MQLEIPLTATPERLSSQLSQLLRMEVKLTLTRSRWSILSSKIDHGSAKIKLDEVFLYADEAVLSAVAKYASCKDRLAGNIINDFFVANRQLISGDLRKERALKKDGKYFDLDEIYERLNVAFFESHVDAKIGWGRRPAQKRRIRTIQLGSYCAREKLITIHRHLDRDEVPLFVVESVVFHEMCHQLAPRADAHKNGRRSHHPKVFKNMEREYPQFKEAHLWIKKMKGFLMKPNKD